MRRAALYLGLGSQRPEHDGNLGPDNLWALGDNQFWVMFWDILRLLKRGDTDKPFAIYLELLYATLPPLLRVLPAEDTTRQGLLVAGYGRDAQKNRTQMVSLLDAYLAARSAIISRHNLAFFPNQGFESEIKRLVQKLI